MKPTRQDESDILATLDRRMLLQAAEKDQNVTERRSEEETMIIRVFRARAQPGMQEEFEGMARELSIPLVEAQKGLACPSSGQASRKQC